MKEVLTPEICVIGASPAGLTVAAAAAALGIPVVLIEKKRMGEECLKGGCLSARALLSAAHRAQAIREAPRFGLRAGEVRADLADVMAHIRGVIAERAPNESADRFIGLGVRVLTGEARFIDDRGVTVENAVVYARRFVVATGSHPVLPPIPNLQNVPYFTTDTIFDLKRLPGRLVIVGGGPTGLEFAQAFSRLGSEVIVFEAEKALAGEDPELAALLLKSLRAEGIDIREGARIVRLARRGRTGVRVVFDGDADFGQVDATHLLIAAPRRPDIEELGLKHARVRHDADGIRVNSRLRTRNPRIYAVGDVVAGARLPHWSVHQAELVLRSILFRFGGKVRPEILPRATATDPELAQVGLSESEARKRHRRIRILRWPFVENDRSHAERATRGEVKVLTTRRGRILGAAILGRDAGELIAPFALAVAQGTSIRLFSAAVFPYATRAEAVRQAAASFDARRFDSPWARRVLALLRRFA